MIVYHIALFLSFISSLYMASFVYNLNRKEPLNRQFAFFAITMAYWAFIEFEGYHSVDMAFAHFWHTKNVFSSLTIVTLLHFILIFTEKTRLLKNRVVLFFLYGMAIFISAVEFFYITTDIQMKMPWGWVLVYTDKKMIMLGEIISAWGSLMGIIIVTISIVYYIKIGVIMKKKQAKFITIGLCFILVFGITTELILPEVLSTAIPRLTSSSFTIAAVFISYSIWKYQLFSIETDIIAENIITTMPDALILADPEKKIIKTNIAALELFMCNENQLLGKSYYTLFQDPSEKHSTLHWESQLFKKRILNDIETDIFTHSGDSIPVAISASVISAGQANSSGIVFIIHDLREQKEGEDAMNTTMLLLEEKRKRLTKANRELIETADQLIQLEKRTMLGELTASIMHELNQPLNVMKVICQSIIRDIRNDRYDPKNTEDELPEIVTQINKMTDIIEHMRTFSMSGTGDFLQIVDMNTIIENTLRVITQQMKIHDIDVRTELTPALEQIKGDPIRLEQMLLNLITNARHALETSAKDKKILTVRTSRGSDGYVMIEINDNGNGIPNDIQDKIFIPFFTTKDSSRGTGLGLSIVKRIISEHNGKIEVESALEKYTTFRIQIPAHAG